MKPEILPELTPAKEAIANAERALVELKRAAAQPRHKRSAGPVMATPAKPAKATPEDIGKRAINEGRAKVLRSPRVRTFTAPK